MQVHSNSQEALLPYNTFLDYIYSVAEKSSSPQELIHNLFADYGYPVTAKEGVIDPYKLLAKDGVKHEPVFMVMVNGVRIVQYPKGESYIQSDAGFSALVGFPMLMPETLV